MSNIHYFPRYSQKENMVTNNTLLLFSRLYNNSPDKFRRLINAILEDSGIELDTTVRFKQQEKISSGRIPDGLIEQESFKVVIETKLYGQEHIDQIKGHWKAFRNEDKQIFLWINKEPISKGYYQQIIEALNIYNDSNKSEIGFAYTTFKDICRCFNDILQEYDLEMKTLIDDYEAFCNESELIDNADLKVRVVLTGQTLEQNLKYNIYYNPSERGYQNTKYIGLYKNKAVRAIGETSCIADVRFNIEKNKLEVLGVIQGTLTDAQKEIIKLVTIEAKEKYGYSVDEGRRFFFVHKYFETDYLKPSKGALMGTRYINLDDVDGFNKEMKASEIAGLLKGKEWDI
ncbi:hypothetical protein [Pseudobacteroides cellulosolvens]|uniref:Uncharacterized protein n=1 Tax=Pseudobacteroides cellulosolvens ATCC 35603 = DSM 2933 TaxID=398512 RepID=A0A0L6JUY0_9FIRM|nr:hypothetical protein [Pseudobacteroides cellulosolvens]KNY29529.1 hypothetical protein Bccel_4803 [Pseudobacteroides cellulosolvens ATCC 35603 = DSM 2933]